jgi:hypothetical protein
MIGIIRIRSMPFFNIARESAKIYPVNRLHKILVKVYLFGTGIKCFSLYHETYGNDEVIILFVTERLLYYFDIL